MSIFKERRARKLENSTSKSINNQNQINSCYGSGLELISSSRYSLNAISTDGYFGKSDPFLKFFKKLGDSWYQVHKTEVIKNNLNPEWQVFEISTIRLSGGDFEAPFKVNNL